MSSGCPILTGYATVGNLTLTLTFRYFNVLRFHSNANKKVIDTQCTFVLFSGVFAATQPRTVLTSLPNACTPPRGSNSRRNAFRINTFKSLSKQTTLTIIESHSYKKHRGWGVLWLTISRLVVSGHSLCSIFSLFAQRVFHNSSAIKRFHTLSQNCRGVTLQFPIWELFAGHRAERPLFSSLPFNGLRTLPSSIVCKSFACHSYENCRVCTNNSHSGSSRATAKGTQPGDCRGQSLPLFIFHQSPVTIHQSQVAHPLSQTEHPIAPSLMHIITGPSSLPLRLGDRSFPPSWRSL